MIRTLLLAVVAQLLLAAAVSADGVPPSPQGMKHVYPHVRFVGLDQHSEYVFFGYSSRVSNPPFPILDENTFRLFWSRGENWVLLAIKRQDFERRAKDAPKLDWLTDQTDGVLSVMLPRPSNHSPEAMTETPVATYHVTLQDGKLSVEVENDPRASAPANWLLLGVFGLVASVSIAWLGLWFVRRRSATPQPKELT